MKTASREVRLAEKAVADHAVTKCCHDPAQKAV